MEGKWVWAWTKEIGVHMIIVPERFSRDPRHCGMFYYHPLHTPATPTLEELNMADAPQPESAKIEPVPPILWNIVKPGLIRYGESYFTIQHFENNDSCSHPYRVYRNNTLIRNASYSVLGEAKKRVVEYHAELIAMGLES